ncbi:MAG: DISARM system SNF2-like helicase DrmD [Armatimonadetes bacterium]|nr:DISARM system SNF2-like helicase DrmD [Armatimonadota bacterium]
MDAPEQGQLVRLRNRHYLIQDVSEHSDDRAVLRRVSLECLDDDATGEPIEVLWEREVNAEILDTSALPSPQGWDSAGRFGAFRHAINWSTNSMIEAPELQAPFHGAIEIEDYQLVPVAKALTMARVSLLIADDVGLGKTIEAALVMQELVTRQLVRRAMVVCPASLQEQWREELQSKFNLPFRIIDREAIQHLRREYGVHVNPWNSFPRLITSMDFLKREQNLQQFRASLDKHTAHPALRDWDLLIVDEVHNCAPSGRKQYGVDSDRTRMLREIAPHFEHRLFLTATPHNGFTESFTAILEMLDPDRFTRGPELNTADRDRVMIRRLKDQITDALGERVFPRREVAAIPVSLEDESAGDALSKYVASRLERSTARDAFAVQFALTMLKKRFLSSPLAFWRSLQTHMRFAGTAAEAADLGLVERMKDKVDEDWDDDEEKALHEETALQEASRFFGQRTADEIGWLRELSDFAQAAHKKPDEKASALLRWIEEHLCPGGAWADERLIVFTEYKDTLEYLQAILSGPNYEGRILTLFGGMTTEQREPVKAAFQASPDENPVRILLATDAASEGLNLQMHCRHIIHYEIPWNPIRMEQRNGRIDRHGQSAPVVYCSHFRYTNQADQQFLNVVVDKVQTQRQDLGAIGDVIARDVELAILGLSTAITDPKDRRQRQEEELKSGIAADMEARRLHDRLLKTRQDLELEPANLAAVLDEALRMAGSEGLRPVGDGELAGRAHELRALPASWADCRSSILNPQGHRLKLVFDHEFSKGRKDVALVHLGHPLMKRAISVFRGCLWEQSTGHARLHRCSYRILPDHILPDPALVAFGRLVAISRRGEKLHEALMHAGGWIKGHNIVPADRDLVDGLLHQPFVYEPIPAPLGDKLRALFPAHNVALEQMLAQLQEAETQRLKGVLSDKATTVSRSMRELIDERLKEIDKRLKDAEKEFEQAQLRLFDDEELGQVRWDLRWLQIRRDDLAERRKQAPAAAAARYDLKSLRVFPLALLYLLPRSMAEGGGH